MLERITLASAQPVLHRADGLVFPIRADWRSSEKTIRIPSEAKARDYFAAFTTPFDFAQGRLLKSGPFKTSTYSEVSMIAEAKVVACQEAHHSN